MRIEVILPETDDEHEQALVALDTLSSQDDLHSRLTHRAQLLLIDDYAGRRGDPDTPDETVAALRRRATATFGNALRAGRWMYQPHYLLGGRRPVDMLSSRDDATRLDRLLDNIGQVIELPRRQA
jgi:uncharacterized protein (DUF2384 family)